MPKTTKHPPFTAAEARREADEHDRQGSDFGDFAEWIALRNDFHRLATTLRHYADLLEELDEAFASTEARTISRLEAATGRVKNPKHLPSPELTARRFHEALWEFGTLYVKCPPCEGTGFQTDADDEEYNCDLCGCKGFVELAALAGEKE
jgi:hypothetical protein